MTLVERGVGRPAVSLRQLLGGTGSPVEGETDAGLEDYVREITSSGFPGLRGYDGRALRAQLDGYIGRIVDTDFLEMGHPVRKPQVLLRWMTAYAAATATTTSYEKILDAATGGEGDKPRKATTQGYRDVLERLWILDPLPAWIPADNPIGRLSQPPKHHLADPALAARLLGAGVDALLAGHEPGPRVAREGTLLGHLFESLVTLDVRVYAQAAEARPGHLRTYGGEREVDLVVEREDRRIVAIETKLSATVDDDDVSNLLWLKERVGDRLLDMVVVSTGPHAYRRRDGVAVVPAALLGP
jgi:uncharacterized protein